MRNSPSQKRRKQASSSSERSGGNDNGGSGRSPTRRSKRRRSDEEEEEEEVVSVGWRFKQPSSDQILKALSSGVRKCPISSSSSNSSSFPSGNGSNNTNNTSSSSSSNSGDIINKQFEMLLAHFDSIPMPKTSSDWLVQFNEQGQTCAQYLRNCPVARGQLGTRQFIYFVQIGDFDETQLDFESLYDYGRCFFNAQVIKKISPKIEIKLTDEGDLVASYEERRSKLKHRRHASSRRVQILAQSLHKFLASIKPADALCVVGFCEFDLYAEESDLFVAGLCDGGLGVGAFSCFRYDPRLRFCDENWYDSRIIRRSNRPLATSEQQHADLASILLVRSCKLLVHETCHLLGMEHCIYLNCCMNGSGHLEEDFEQSMFLCPIDLKKLAFIVDFDLVGRYKRMKQFFDKHNAVAESQWLAGVIHALEDLTTTTTTSTPSITNSLVSSITTRNSNASSPNR